MARLRRADRLDFLIKDDRCGAARTIVINAKSPSSASFQLSQPIAIPASTVTPRILRYTTNGQAEYRSSTRINPHIAKNADSEATRSPTARTDHPWLSR